MIDTSLIERVNENLVLLEAYGDLPENYYGRLRNRKDVTSKEVKDFICFVLADEIPYGSEALLDLFRIGIFLELEGEKYD